jgi:hypothetical protein
MPKQTRTKQQKQSQTLVEGMAKCINNQGMETLLQNGQVVFVREIKNMRGHCIVLRNQEHPLVGYHLERFELLNEDEV